MINKESLYEPLINQLKKWLQHFTFIVTSIDIKRKMEWGNILIEEWWTIKKYVTVINGFKLIAQTFHTLNWNSTSLIPNMRFPYNTGILMAGNLESVIKTMRKLHFWTCNFEMTKNLENRRLHSKCQYHRSMRKVK